MSCTQALTKQVLDEAALQKEITGVKLVSVFMNLDSLPLATPELLFPTREKTRSVI